MTLILNGFTYDLDTPKVELDGIEYSAAAFNEMETRIWDITFRRLFALGEDPVARIFKAYQGHLFAAARVAKAALNNPVFAGAEGASTQMVMQELQAWHVFRTTDATETPAKSWIMSLTIDEDYWIGYGTNNLNSINIDKDLCPVLIALADLTTNRAVRSIKIKVGDVDHKPIGVERLQLAPASDRVPIMPIKTLILTPRQVVLGKTYSDAAITNGKLMLVGVTYGLGSKLTYQYYTKVDL
jgi:hypothetical protein